MIRPLRWLRLRYLRMRGRAWKVHRVYAGEGAFTLKDGTKFFFADPADAYNVFPGQWVTFATRHSLVRDKRWFAAMRRL